MSFHTNTHDHKLCSRRYSSEFPNLKNVYMKHFKRFWYVVPLVTLRMVIIEQIVPLGRQIVPRRSERSYGVCTKFILLVYMVIYEKKKTSIGFKFPCAYYRTYESKLVDAVVINFQASRYDNTVRQ